MKNKTITLILIFLMLSINCFSGDDKGYVTGHELKLMIKVNIWGEVRNPGEFLVEDGADLISLISIAGGPTNYANLRKVKLIRNVDGKKTLIKINIKKYTDSSEKIEIPTLLPGDVIIIPKSIRADWNMIIQVISQIAIILNVIYVIKRD